MTNTTWVRDGAPRYTRQLTRGRVATATKVRRPIEFSWQIVVRTARGDSFTVCSAVKFADAKRAFEACAKAGVTQYGRPFAGL